MALLWIAKMSLKFGYLDWIFDPFTPRYNTIEQWRNKKRTEFTNQKYYLRHHERHYIRRKCINFINGHNPRWTVGGKYKKVIHWKISVRVKFCMRLGQVFDSWFIEESPTNDVIWLSNWNWTFTSLCNA